MTNLEAKLKTFDWEFEDDDTNFATHNLHRYSSKYIPQIPERLIRATTKIGGVVLDPFLGSGTTLIEANRLSRHSIGVDINPVAILISQVKTKPLDLKMVDKEIMALIKELSPRIITIRSKSNSTLKTNGLLDISYNLPKFPRADAWYQPEVLIELSVIKEYINSKVANRDMKLFFACAFSAIARSVSNTSSGYGNLMIDKNKRKITNTFEVFQSQLFKMRDGIEELNKIFDKNYKVKIVQSDCQDMKFIEDRSIDSVITHPPYISAVPYAEYLMLSLLWLEDSFSNLFDKNHGDTLNFRKLDSMIIGGKRNRTDVVARFNEGMRNTFQEMYRVLKPKGYCSIVIGNPVVKGEMIRCDETFDKIAKDIGFILQAKIRRGKYRTTMGKMKEEFILIFSK